MKLILPVTAAILFAGAASAGEVTVSVEGVTGSGGSLLVALQTEEQFLQKDAAYAEAMMVSGATAEVQFSDVEAGNYVVAVVHDQDGDGDFTVSDTGPAEAWGLSGTMSAAGAPEFETHAVEVMDDGTTEATVSLNYPS